MHEHKALCDPVPAPMPVLYSHFTFQQHGTCVVPQTHSTVHASLPSHMLFCIPEMYVPCLLVLQIMPP